MQRDALSYADVYTNPFSHKFSVHFSFAACALVYFVIEKWAKMELNEWDYSAYR